MPNAPTCPSGPGPIVLNSGGADIFTVWHTEEFRYVALNNNNVIARRDVITTNKNEHFSLDKRL